LLPHPAESPATWPWPALAAGFAVLWLLTLAWALLRRGQRRLPAAPDTSVAQPASRYAMADLRKAIDAGGFDEVARILCDMAAVADMDAVVARLEDPSQRQAVLQMQRARWGGEGDIAPARAALRQAFRQGVAWQRPPMAEKTDLDPLYPTRN
jgi:hypothetical protein